MTWVKANSRIHALPSPAMTTPSGWEPRPGPTRGDQARRVPRGTGGWPPDEADPRRQVPRGTGPVAGRGWDADPGGGQGRDGRDGRGQVPPSIPDRAPRDSGPWPAPARGGQRPVPDANGYDRRGGRPDDFAGRPRPSGEVLTSDRGRPGGRPGGGFDGLRPEGLLRWLGTMSTLTAVLVLAGATLIGVVLTLMMGTEPGNLLGFFVIVGSLIAVARRPSRRGLPLLPGARPRLLRGRRGDRPRPRPQARVVDGGPERQLPAVGGGHLLAGGGGDRPRAACRRRPLAAQGPARHGPVPAVRGPPGTAGQRAQLTGFPPPRRLLER